MKIKTHFRRFEFKYILPKATADKIIPALMEHMVWDEYASEFPDNAYIVTSYYLDSNDYACYYDKLSGLDYRAKYRIRTYRDTFDINQHLGDKVFAEIKRKKANIIIKDRSSFIWGDLRDIIKGVRVNEILTKIDGEQRKTVNEFLWSKSYNCLKPSIVVSYLRRPLVSKYDDRFRVTFDYNIKTQAINNNFETYGPIKKVLDQDIVLELKYNNTLPEWFHHIIQDYKLHLQSYSKYCSSLEKIEYNLIN